MGMETQVWREGDGGVVEEDHDEDAVVTSVHPIDIPDDLPPVPLYALVGGTGRAGFNGVMVNEVGAAARF
jgi:hypothetical protein